MLLNGSTESEQTNKRRKLPVERFFQLFSASSSFSKFAAFLFDTDLDFSECKSQMERSHWPGRNHLEKIKEMTWKLEEKASRSSLRKVLIRNSKVMLYIVVD